MARFYSYYNMIRYAWWRAAAISAGRILQTFEYYDKTESPMDMSPTNTVNIRYKNAQNQGTMIEYTEYIVTEQMSHLRPCWNLPRFT